MKRETTYACLFVWKRVRVGKTLNSHVFYDAQNEWVTRKNRSNTIKYKNVRILPASTSGRQLSNMKRAEEVSPVAWQREKKGAIRYVGAIFVR